MAELSTGPDDIGLPLGGGSPTPAPGTPETPEPLPTVPVGTPATTPEPEPEPSTPPPAPPAPKPTGKDNLTVPANAKSWTYFKSPSGNIKCDIYDYEYGGVSCSIAEYSYEDPPEPPGNQINWGGGMTIVEGRAETLNRGDVLDAEYRTDVPVLGYGQTARIGEHACRSEEAGMICWNTRTQHGFTLARERYTTF